MNAFAQTGHRTNQLLESDESMAAAERKRFLERELARYVRLLAQHSDPEQIIVFGSLSPWHY